MREDLRTIDAAIRVAEYCAGRYGRTYVVHHVVGPDQFGRADVFYVLDESQAGPVGSTIAYRREYVSAS